jgi:CRP-like cAMP-binding protein
MAVRDFFAFCRALPLLELKAISQLSRVRHVEENDIVFSAGASGDELFIINHGLVEIAPEPFQPGMIATVLSRGDVFGESGALLHHPRHQTARARAPLSLQCFQAKDFQELLRRAPSFFLFLCEKLANYRYQASQMAKSQEGNLELTGSLANFDVVTIHQTIIRSMQTGLLTVADENAKTVCEFYFDKGTPRWGRFQQLKGEEAFWQLFIQTRRGWTFSFSKKALVREDWTDDSAISHNPDEMLIKAMQMRDEFEDLCKRMSDGAASLKRQKLNFAWPRTDIEELRPLAEEIWQIAYSQPISLTDLSGRCSQCGLKVYRAVDEMVGAGIVALQSNGETPKPVEAAP